MNCFKSWSDEQLIEIGALAVKLGIRPSSLFDWNDPSDFVERLLFDRLAVGKFLEVEAREYRKLRSRLKR